MFGFSKKEIFMNTDPELFFRITAALKEHGIRYETKHVNGTTVNWMTGTAASVGETLRRQTSYYAYVDKKDAEEAAYIVKKALERRSEICTKEKGWALLLEYASVQH